MRTRPNFTLVGICLCVLVAAFAIAASGCASRTNPPDVTVLQTGSTVLQTASALQKGITAATDAGSLPVPLARKLTGYVEVVYAKSGQLETAVQAYHLATAIDVRRLKAAEIQALLTDLNAPLGKLLAEALPAGVVRQLTLLAGNVMAAIASVQLSIASSVAGG